MTTSPKMNVPEPTSNSQAAPKVLRKPQGLARFLPRGLSGKLLVLTSIFIMLIEIFVFIPSVANFRLTWLARHFNTAEAASLTLEGMQNSAITPEIRQQLLDLTRTDMIVVRRDGASRVLLSRQMPREIAQHVELTQPGRRAATRSIFDAMDTLIFGGDRIIRVFGPMEQRSGTLELVMEEKPLRTAMLQYAGNVLLISLLISLVTAVLVFIALRWFLIRPMQRMSGAMVAFAQDPEREESMVAPSGRDDEIGVAEEQLHAMQRQVRDTLKQRRHLADLGLAVSKINHDLRNILSSASLFSDRLTSLPDPTVQRLAPRLVRTIDRAADYTRSVLAYGSAGEAEPKRAVVRLHRLCEDVAEALALDLTVGGDGDVEWVNGVDPDLEISADPEQLFRILMNLSRNAVQAMELLQGDDVVRRLTVQAKRQTGTICILISDTGPGVESSARDNLFAAFKTNGRKGGTGLGLAIAAELVMAHKGTIQLTDTPPPGATFEILLPQ
ncbi:MAG: HAMP domain-containing sensor histidine kinase [Pseudomonadota bacterium]